LATLLPAQLSTAYFVNSGAEANEAAVKLAKRLTGRHEIVAFKKGYHGNTMGAMSFSANEVKKRSFRPLIPGTRFIPFDDVSALSQVTSNTAAVIIEPIQGDAGVIIPSQAFMQALRAKCDEHDAILIFDEVQTGIGRTGKMFAFEHFNIIPDIVTLAKGLGGGLPIGAFISSYDNMRLLADNPMLGHITTFGGNPVSCAAAGVVVNEVSLFEEHLSHNAVKDLRRKGLMIAIELESEEKVNEAIALALQSGVIIYWFLSTRNAFRISPPLNISEEEIIEACQRLRRIFDQL
jgi:acetylornithine/succinyldiaminopimelate/putrescine aminotransferase